MLARSSASDSASVFYFIYFFFAIPVTSAQSPISNSFRLCLPLFGSVCCFVYSAAAAAAAQAERADCGMFKLLSLAGYGERPPWGEDRIKDVEIKNESSAWRDPATARGDAVLLQSSFLPGSHEQEG